MAFYVGQRVVCVNNGVMLNNVGLLLPAPTLKEGKIYTVTRVLRDGSVTLYEALPAFGCGSFNELRFRPVVEREYDISIFKAMLNPSDERESVS